MGRQVEHKMAPTVLNARLRGRLSFKRRRVQEDVDITGIKCLPYPVTAPIILTVNHNLGTKKRLDVRPDFSRATALESLRLEKVSKSRR